MNNKLNRDNLIDLSSKLEDVIVLIENLLEKETVSGFKIMLTKLKSNIYEHKVILQTGIEAYDFSSKKGESNV